MHKISAVRSHGASMSGCWAYVAVRPSGVPHSGFGQSIREKSSPAEKQRSIARSGDVTLNPTDLNGGQGRNRTTDTRIFRPLPLVLGA